MLNNFDMKSKYDKDTCKEIIEEYDRKLSSLSREIEKHKIPVMIIFEGWGAAGKGELINELIMPIDPRSFIVYSSFNQYSEEEKYKPRLWKFWKNTPERGKIAIFDKSWYKNIITEYTNKKINEKEYKSMIRDSISFEQTLINDNYVIIKIFLHISKEEQKRRFEKIEKQTGRAWMLKKEDYDQNNRYDVYLDSLSRVIEDSNTKISPWNIISSDNKKIAQMQIKEKVILEIEKALERNKEMEDDKEDIYLEKSENILAKYDLSLDIEKEKYKQELKDLQEELKELSFQCYAKRIPVIIAYEGWDAAGKGGNIRRLTEKMDPRGYQVVPISSPTQIELNHNHLWRFWTKVPKAGHFTIFDRTWYGRVLVERIEGYCSVADWKRAYGEINDMERGFSEFGIEIFKFWIHIDKEEQFKRFKARKENPEKQWKITPDDWRNRDKWDQYEEAVNDMLSRTSTKYAPWDVIESNSKKYARIKVLKIVVERLKKRLKEA